jgi:hypothetical protein
MAWTHEHDAAKREPAPVMEFERVPGAAHC